MRRWISGFIAPLVLISLHSGQRGTEGQPVTINADHITMIRPADQRDGLFSTTTRATIYLLGNHTVRVRETITEIEAAIAGQQGGPTPVPKVPHR